MYFTLESNSTNYNKPIKFISWPNFFEEHHILSHEIWGKFVTDCFNKYSDGYIFSNPVINKMDNTQNILC